MSTHLAVTLLSDPSSDGQCEWQFSEDPTIRIGRSPENEIELRDPRVSRLHATLRHNGSAWVCESLGRNGTFFNGQLVENMTLSEGTVLEFSKPGPRLHFRMVNLDGQIGDTADPSVVQWVEHMASGDAEAASALWGKYFQPVLRLARSRMSTAHRRASDEEDVAASVFESLCDGMASGRFPDLKDHDSLWRLLCIITRRKVARHLRHERRQKRGGGMVRGDSAFEDSSGGGSRKGGFDQIEGQHASDEFGMHLIEETQELLDVLGEGELRQITELKFAEYTNDEIAESLGCHVRTVKRRLQTIRSILASSLARDD